jgi:hypothetical protein
VGIGCNSDVSETHFMKRFRTIFKQEAFYAQGTIHGFSMVDMKVQIVDSLLVADRLFIGIFIVVQLQKNSNSIIKKPLIDLD